MALQRTVTAAPRFRAIVLFELRRRWHGHRLWVALVIIGLSALLLGVLTRGRMMYPGDARQLYHCVYLLMLALVFRFDLAHDIDLGFADFMAPNFVDVGSYVRARLFIGVAAVLQFGVVALVLTALAPAFSLGFAAWAMAAWLLAALLFAPFVALAEIWLRTRLPVLAVALLTTVLLFLALSVSAFDTLEKALGTDQLVAGSFASLGGLTWRAALVGVPGLALVQPIVRRHWSPD